MTWIAVDTSWSLQVAGVWSLPQALASLLSAGPSRDLFLLPGGNIRLKLLPTFWLRFVTRLLLFPKFKFTWLLLLLLAFMLLLMLRTEGNI